MGTDNETKIEPIDIQRHLAKAVSQTGTGFKAHLTVYLATNIFLVFINIFTGGHFPWAFFTIAPWFVGLAAHFQSILNRRRRQKRQIASKKYPTEVQALIQTLHHIEARYKQHRNAFLTANGFLIGTNLITSAAVPWALFPLGGWLIGFLAHRGTFKAKEKYILKRLANYGISWKKLGDDISLNDIDVDMNLDYPEVSSADVPLPPNPLTLGRRETVVYYQEASGLKAQMIEELKNNKELKSHWGNELETQLTKFITQIQELEHMHTELDNAITTSSENDLKMELEILEQKMNKAKDEALISEYTKSIAQYKHQLDTIDDLKNKQEIIELRLKSSLMLIKQLKLDSTRLKNLKSVEEPFVLKEIRQKSQEMSSYLEDFNKSYRELTSGD